MHNVLTLVLGGGRGTRLYPLTKFRSKPAVPLAGKYRLIDIPLSNCINSGLNRIYVLTQFLSVSLHRHIRQSYRFDQFNGGFVELLAAQQTMDDDANADWYQGTADAVRKNIRYLQQPGIDYVLILSGDQLYRMDYADLVRTHCDAKADITIAAMPVTRQAAPGLGIMQMNDAGRVVSFCEKPQTKEETDKVRTDPAWIDKRGVESRGRDCLGNMGIYLFGRDTLLDMLTQSNHRDFGRELFPQSINTHHVQMHLFDDYWEDIGTIKAFFEANLALVGPSPSFTLRHAEEPVYSRGRFLPPTNIDGATVSQSMIADGCHIGKGSVIENSVIGLRCMIGDNVTIRNSVLMGADAYESDERLAQLAKIGQPRMGIGAGSVIEGAIVDKNCRIGENVRVVNSSGIQDGPDADDCVVRDGIPVVVKDATLPSGWRLS
jgi:glucose-1-phosphate adenylyltransferase